MGKKNEVQPGEQDLETQTIAKAENQINIKPSKSGQN